MLSTNLKVRPKLLSLDYKAFNDLPLLILFSLTSSHPLTSSLELSVYLPEPLIPMKPQPLTSLQGPLLQDLSCCIISSSFPNSKSSFQSPLSFVFQKVFLNCCFSSPHPYLVFLLQTSIVFFFI